MDPTQLATQAVALLAPYLTAAGKAAAQKAGAAAGQQFQALMVAIRRRLSSEPDTYGQQTLARLEQEPEAQPRQRALADVLAEKAEADAGFARELEQLVQSARQEPAVGRFLTQVYGHGRVDQLFNIGSVQTLNVGRVDPD